MKLDFTELNPEQLLAVKTVNGPVIVFAGAGTGKTKTLIARIAFMIKEKSILPRHILAITFTKKATNEMRERIMNYVGPVAGAVHISTIHSFCASVLRQKIELLGYTKNFEIIDDEDALKILSDVYRAEDIDRKAFSPKAALNAISSFKNGIGELFGLSERIYQSYQAHLKQINLVDFDDLLLLTHELFRDFPDVTTYYSWKFQYILVDEFQDTNYVQYEIIKLLAGERHNVFVVGDDDQSIYSFRGARVDNMYQFMKDFTDVKVIKLEKNYRSSNALLKGANAVISNNKVREPKTLFSDQDGRPQDVIVYKANYFEDEVYHVAAEIQNLIAAGYLYRDIAVLYRNSAISRNFELVFIQKGIPYQIFGGFSYLKRREIKDVISYLRFILDPNNLLHFRRIINQPARGIGVKTIGKLRERMDKDKISLFEAIERVYEENPSSKNEALKEFKELVLHLNSELNQHSLVTFYSLVLEKTGYLDMIRSEDTQEINREANLEEFKSILYQIEQNLFDDHRSNQQLLEYCFDEVLLDDTLAAERVDKQGVVLSTIHSIKGLEFKAVFVVALEEGIFPSLRDEGDMEEERRVAYVAFTRAKERIYLTCADKRLIYGRMVRNSKSRFLTEYLNCCDKLSENINMDVEIPEKVPGEIKVFDRIYHTNYGYGLVIAVAGPNIQVIFDKDHSLRSILKNHAAVTKC